MKYDMRPVYRWHHWLGRWVFMYGGRVIGLCPVKFDWKCPND